MITAKPTQGIPVDFKVKIDLALTHIFDSATRDAAEIDPVYVELLQRTKAQVLRSGKRLRPYLTYLSYTGYGKPELGDLFSVASAQELFHNFLLIHDDVIDRDLIRHGSPNIIASYIDQLSSLGLDTSEASHYASSYAILAGNALSALALRAITGTSFDAQSKLAAVTETQKMLFEEMGGQQADISVAIPGASTPSLEQLTRICRFKTASYTFETPLRVGAILAGASSSNLHHLTQYARATGIVFQIADDLLGVYGSAVSLGKPILSDIQEGKNTILIHYARALCSDADKARLAALWGNREAGPDELEAVKQILETSGAKAKTEDLALEYVSKATSSLPGTNLTSDAQIKLAELAEFSIKRTS